MKFNLTTAFLVLTCFAILLAWYAERSRYNNEKSQWNAERINLVHAGMMLAGQDFGDSDLEPDVDDNVQFGLELPEKEQQLLDAEQDLDYLVIYVNLENEMKTILGEMVPHEFQSEVNLVFIELIDELWRGSGKPDINAVEKHLENSDWLTIKRPEALKSWLKKLKNP